MVKFAPSSILVAALAAVASADDSDDNTKRQLRKGGKNAVTYDTTDRDCSLTKLPTGDFPIKQSIIDFRLANGDGTEGGDPANFPNMPCGVDVKVRQDGSIKKVDNKCTYFPTTGKLGMYECETTSRKAQAFIDDAIEGKFFQTTDQLCAIDGFEVKRISQWYWQCICVDTDKCNQNLVDL